MPLTAAAGGSFTGPAMMLYRSMVPVDYSQLQLPIPDPRDPNNPIYQSPANPAGPNWGRFPTPPGVEGVQGAAAAIQAAPTAFTGAVSKGLGQWWQDWGGVLAVGLAGLALVGIALIRSDAGQAAVKVAMVA